MKKTLFFLVVMTMCFVPVLGFGESSTNIVTIGKATGEQITLLDQKLSQLLKKRCLTEGDVKELAKLSDVRKQLVECYIQLLGISLIGKAQQLSVPQSSSPQVN